MARAKLILPLIFTLIFSSAFADRLIKIQEVPKIMQQLFAYHIENKEFSPTIIRRCFKIYIEQFDPDKTYLLRSEAEAFLSVSDAKAGNISERMKKGDFSDFLAMNQLFKQAISRSHKWREEIKDQIVSLEIFRETDAPPSQFALDERELKERQKNRMVRFFHYHMKKNAVTDEKREKLFALLDRKLKRLENPYLFLDPQGKSFSKELADHYIALKIMKSFSKSLDAHTSFFSEEEAYEMRMNLEKQFEGLGIVLSEGIDGVVISEIMQGSPADMSNRIKVGDLLIEIDGASLANVPFETVLQMLKKKDKSAYVLGIERAQESKKNPQRQFFTVSLHKKPIVMQNDRLTYTYDSYGDGIIAKITLNSFYESGGGINSERDLKEALKKLREIAPIRGLILDFRENAGGFLSQAVKVAGLFIANGVVVVSKYGKGEVHYLRSLDPKTYYNGPLVILTSKLSASAAEIVAQSLQDYGVALIVGDERTFGKGSIQFQTVTDEKADYFFKVTVGKYYTVSGKSTQIEGVIADIVIPTHFSPFNIGERYLEYPLLSDQISSAYSDSLIDLEGNTKRWFQKNYLPFLQKKVTFWRKMVPELKKSSEQRIANDPKFQKFLQNQERIKSKISGKELLWEEIQSSAFEDLQMQESVQIVKEMILLEERSRKSQGVSDASAFWEKAG